MILRHIFILLLFTFLLATPASPQTIIPAGPVSGTWTLAGSPYLVEGDIIVPRAQTLIIDPGVDVIFQDHYKFTIAGMLQAVGTEIDTIVFTASNANTGWNGLRFYDLNSQPDSSRLIYCLVEYGRTADSGEEDRYGGALFAQDSDLLTIRNCTFFKNRTASVIGTEGEAGISGSYYGGAGCSGSAATSGHGGAVYISNSNLELRNNLFLYNTTGKAKGGDGGNGGWVTGINGVGGDAGIGANGTSGSGGALYCIDSSPSVVGNVFHHNGTGTGEGGDGGYGGSVPYYWGASIGVGGDGGDGGDGKAGNGAALYIEDSAGLWANNLFYYNRAGAGCGGEGGHGGSVAVPDTSSQREAWGGYGGYGGSGWGGQGSAVCFEGSVLRIIFQNNTIVNNYRGAGTSAIGGLSGSPFVGNGGGGNHRVGESGLFFSATGPTELNHLIIWDNEDPVLQGSPNITYSCIEDGYPGLGNIDNDPLFITNAAGDYFLSQIAAGQSMQSPCVDAGNPGATMITGTTRTDGVQDHGIVDMGFHYTLFANLPVLGVTADSLYFEAAFGGANPPYQTFEIINTYVSSFNFNIIEDAQWLTVFPQSGGPVPPAAEITLSIDITALSVGFYEEEVIVDAPGAQGSPDTVHVYLNIGESHLLVQPDTLFFQAGLNGPNPPAQYLYINNTAMWGLCYTVVETVPWLSLSSNFGGPLPPADSIAINADIGGLVVGTYEEVIIISAEGAVGSPDTVIVSLQIEPPVLSYSPDSLVFSAVPEGSNPAEQTILIDNIGPGIFSFIIVENIDWLAVEPGGGSTVPPAATATVSVDVSGLDYGIYTGTIQILAPDALGSPGIVHVTLFMIDPILEVEPDTLIFTTNITGYSPPDQSISVSNTGPGFFNYTVLEVTPWLTVTPEYGGPVPPVDSLTASVCVSGLALGLHEGSILIEAPGAGQSSQEVFVLLDVTVLNPLAGEIQGALNDTTYNIIDEVWIPAGDTLFISAGTDLIFQAEVELNAYGCVQASGDPADSIHFYPESFDSPWRGITLWDSSQSESAFQYCIIEGSNSSGVKIHRKNPVFEHCRISRNTSTWGAGVMSEWGNLSFTDVMISYNDATGFYACGGGVYLIGGHSQFNHCVISHNSVSGYQAKGGGVICSIDSSAFRNCTITHNLLPFGNNYYGGGIFCQSSNLVVNNTLLALNDKEVIYFSQSQDADVSYCDFYSEIGWISNGTPPPGFSLLSQTNANGDSCDVYYNIFLDPLFVDPDSGDYHLLEGSPCIDAGNPASPWDPDSTVADIGAFYFHQQTGGLNNDRNQLIPKDFCLLPAYPNPFNPQTTIRFGLPAAVLVKIAVYDIRGRKIAALTDGWRQAGYHDVTFDAENLASGVYFYRINADNFTVTGKLLLIK